MTTARRTSRKWSNPGLPRCTECGRPDRLWIYRRPTDDKYGEYCQACTDKHSAALTKGRENGND